RIAHYCAGHKDQRLVLGVQQGYGFVATLANLGTRQRAGKQFVTVEKGNTLLKPLPLAPDSAWLAMYSKNERFLVVALDELKTLAGGGKGTQLMGLDKGDKIAQWLAVGPHGMVARGIYRNKETQVMLDAHALAEYVGKRARKGKQLGVKIRQPDLFSASPDSAE
ncbi:MAG: DNA topoisomerase IV subunit A, partial [Burkholderiaceae bacterium]